MNNPRPRSTPGGDPQPHVLVVMSLDTKAPEAAFLRDRIEETGCRALLLDVSMLGEPGIAPDIGAAEVARAGGAELEAVRSWTDTNQAAGVMIAGAVAKARQLLDEGRLDAVISVGGASGTAVGTSIMKGLPFGVPKLMVSSMASVPAYAAQYFGTRDITLMHSVVDVGGLNELMCAVLANAAGAVCGMARAGVGAVKPQRRERPLIALTEFKFAEGCARLVRDDLVARGYEVIPWHANGIGDRAMEELIEQGLFDGVIDLVPAGVLEELLGGNRAAGPSRLEAAARAGVPQVIAPSGLDMLSCGPLERREKDDTLWTSHRLAERAMFVPDAFRVQVRTSVEELREVAGVMAAKLAEACAPVRFLVPRGGWSNLSGEGGPLEDRQADAAFLEAFRAQVRGPVEIQEVEAPLNSPEFARAAVDALEEVLRERAAAEGRAARE